ncbi:MAG TPA: VWA domain-containing protein [Phycisphaerae bacterium]|nr:VWA domain-containing protein [Phycisphaerae bacterium]HNU43773.1 VWA domain-containing protein [Phycisphaerae bacterium]
MMAKRFRAPRPARRKAVVAVQVAVSLVALIGFVALTVDLGYVYNTRSDLQRTADAAALAAAARLADFAYGDPIELARAEAQRVVQANAVMGKSLSISPTADVTFYRANYDAEANVYELTETETQPDAVRVRIRMGNGSGGLWNEEGEDGDDSPNGPVELMFARVFGLEQKDMAAEGTAVMVPRDIAIVADLSGSHTDDSEFAHYKLTNINIFDVWAAFPDPDRVTTRSDGLGFTSVVNVTNNGDGTSTVSIDLTSDGSGATPALSHLTLGLPEAAWAMALATASSGGGYPVETGNDPTTGVAGLKFDETSLGDDGQVQTESFGFTISNDYLAQMTVATKAGAQSANVVHSLRPGPAWGYMSEWGTYAVTSGYSPSADAGLWYLPYNANWSNATLEALWYAQGYNYAEVQALKSKSYDASGSWPYRTAVALGLAYWNSGISGGLWQKRGAPAGNGNTAVGSNELEWFETFGTRSATASRDIFLDYINNYMKLTSTSLYSANSSFRYRFGIKTFINYLMEKRPENSNTPELANTPEQPMQAVKDAVQFMVELIDGLDSEDQVSLEVYGTIGRHERDLTLDVLSIGTRMQQLQAGHYDSYTNIGDGIYRAIEELRSTRARGASRKIIVLLTDGNANRPTGVNAAQYARDAAQAAADQGYRIFAVSVGADSDQALMEDIADIGHGEHFHAGGSIEQYSAQLAAIFQRLGGQRPVELIR